MQTFDVNWAEKTLANENKQQNAMELILLAGGNAELADKLKDALETKVEAVNVETPENIFYNIFEKVKQILPAKATASNHHNL